MNESNKNSSSDRPGEFKIEFDSQSGDGLQKGMEALQQVFGGFVQSIKDAIGPEMIRNMEAAQWLDQLATCLEEIATGLRETGSVPPEAAGKLAFHVDGWDSSLKGSKLEARQAALRERLQTAEQAIQQVTQDNAEHQAALVGQAAGYFRAAAKSIIPMQAGGDSGK